MTTDGPVGPHQPTADATAVFPEQPDGDASAEAEGARRDRGNRTKKIILEWGILIVAAITIALLIRAFVFAAFYIPSASMEPTLYEGDRILVNKLSYDVHDVNRGDIVVFPAPDCVEEGDVKDFVKRVIGLPGETVTYEDGSVLVDGRKLKEPYLRESSKNTVALSASPSCGAPESGESGNSEVPAHCGAPANGEPGCVVPKDRVFVLGDNRTASQDGRVFGSIPQSTIIGHVFLRIWPIGDIGFF